jgi:hypothetical protein
MRTKIPKRLFYSLLIVLLWLGFVVDGSHALFSDAATLAGNTITTGTADLLVSNSQNASSTVFEESRPGFAFTLSPGESGEKYFLLKNASGGNVDFDLSLSATVPNGNSPLATALNLAIQEIDETGTPTGTVFSVPLSSLLSEPTPLGLTIGKSTTKRFKLRTSLSSAYGTQADSISYDLVFTGNQHLN